MNKIEGPIAVVGIVGRYRSGKSYFLNQLIGKQGAFKVDHYTNGCTQGLWLWSEVKQVKTPEGKTINVLFVDTEGLDDVDKEQNHFIRIYMFVHWLSSHLIVNVTSVIDH